jgi:hypothetical protein
MVRKVSGAKTRASDSTIVITISSTKTTASILETIGIVHRVATFTIAQHIATCHEYLTAIRAIARSTTGRSRRAR